MSRAARGLELLVTVLLAVVTSAASNAAAQTWTDFQVGGVTRKALVYVPSGIDHPPLLISLHGRGIPASWNQAEMMKFEPIADREKFVVVYPEALMDLNWDLGGSSDIDFVRQIIDDMSAQHDIDRNRVYASGFSMGGMFSYVLACKVPDLIAAIAPGDGYPLGPFGRSGCMDTRPVPIFHMHGTADDFVAYSGIHAYLQSWITAYGCPTTPVETRPYPASNPSSQSFKELWGPCTNDAGQQSEVVLVSVTGMIHDWATAGKANANEDPAFMGKPFDIDGSEEAWAFLKNHSLENAVGGSGSAGTGGAGGAGSGGGGAGGGSGAGMGGAGSAAGMGGAGTAGMGAAGASGLGNGQTGGSGGQLAGSGGSAAIMPQAGQPAPALAPVDRAAASKGGCACVVGSTSGPGGSLAVLLCLAIGRWFRAPRRAPDRRRPT